MSTGKQNRFGNRGMYTIITTLKHGNVGDNLIVESAKDIIIQVFN